MAERVIQSSFNVGELAPALFARTDLQKYHSAAALVRNFFVDYRGGVSTRPGTRYICQAYRPGRIRLLPFQASFAVDYVIEVGAGYMRFTNNGAPVLEPSLAVGAANPYAAGDWLFYAGTGTALDGNYFIVAVPGNVPILTDLFGNPIAVVPSTGTVARVYTLPSPYQLADLPQIKYTQDVSTMILCHPNHPPYALTLVTASNWSLAPIAFGTAVQPPTNVGVASSNLGSGQTAYAYVVTAVDNNGNESGPSLPGTLTAAADVRSKGGSIRISWTGVTGAASYNVYKSEVTYFAAVPPGVTYGYIGSTTGTALDDSNIAPDDTNTPPILQTPFLGGSAIGTTVTAPGAFSTTFPTATVPAPGAPGTYGAQLSPILSVIDPITVAPSDNSSNYDVGDSVTFVNGVVAIVATTKSGGVITSYQSVNFAGASNIAVTASPLPTTSGQKATSGSGTGARASFTFGLQSLSIVSPGSGYTSPQNVTITPANGASATMQISANLLSYPEVPAFYQQRLFLGGGVNSPSTFYMSQPGRHYNFNISNPIEADDSIQGSLVSSSLNTIKSAVAAAGGLIIFTDKASWLLNGGSYASAVSPAAIVANPQSYNGANDLPPILSNYDVLYVQSKGSVVRDANYNIYAQIYTGQDISLMSSHLFYGYQLQEWAYAEEPFKIIWVIRNDGIALSLTFVKEQEFIAWAHSDTAGVFESVCSVVEPAAQGDVDAVYFSVQRTINGQVVRYIERLDNRQFTNAATAWCVDCGIGFSGNPTTDFSGAQQLAGQIVTGLADGKVIPPFVMPANGSFTLATAASQVVVGLGFTAQLQTLALDTGEPTVQGRMKKITAVTLRVLQALSLKIGSSFSSLVLMKDTVIGNVGKMSNAPVTDLVTGDIDTILDPRFTVPGQYCIQQDQPLPATILGVIPKFVLGDDK